jgi:hypothetical protein
MDEEIDDLIERKEAELSPLRLHLEEFRRQFTRETAAFASEWYRKTTKEYIIKYPEVTLSLTEEKIALMKAGVNELVKNTEKMVERELGKPNLWWHIEPHLHESIEQYRQIADKPPEVLDRAVRRVLGQLGVVLEKFGFHVTASGSNTEAYYEFWFERSVGAREIVPCYPHLLRWTDDMQDTIRRYNVHYMEASEIYGEIQQLKSEKKKLEALTRWNSI